MSMEEMNDMDMNERIDASHSIWQGKRVRLRAVELEDWEVFFAWNQDDEQSRSLYHVPLPGSREAIRRQVEGFSTEEPNGDNFRFAIENEAGMLVGDITTHDCDPRVGTLSYGLNTLRGFRRHGYASEAIALVLRYYFEERRYQKVTVGAYSFNEASIRLHERLGFQTEGRIRRTTFTKGQYFDTLLFGLTREEFAASPCFAALLPDRDEAAQ